MRIFVGVSGGVDSATTASLLKEQGHEVIGCFIKIWQPEFLECTWREDRLDAMRVCSFLHIPFRELDLSEAYRKSVISDLIGASRSGLTPNPDVLCNRHIKFGAFKEWALSEGAEKIATGHYARISPGDQPHLMRAVDMSKDQTYFLWQLTASDLSVSLFPLGELTKQDVRRYALRRGLPVALKPDSQGLCFVGDISMRDFMSRYIEVTPGLVRTEDGNVIGEHQGTAFYTIGQRHGFTTHTAEPLFVIRKDLAENVLIVSADSTRAAHHSWQLRDENILERIQPHKSYQIQTRYHGPIARGTVRENAHATSIHCDAPIVAAPGQSAVIYDGDIVVAGGILDQSVNI